MSSEPDGQATMSPQQFAAIVREATDEQLRAGLAANRDLLLNEIFRQMPAHFDSQRAADVEATVEWRILEADGEGHDSWHLVMRQGCCEVQPGAVENASVTYEIDGVDFIRLITGHASGPKLFLFVRLKIRGNLLLAARMPAFFKLPSAQ